MNHNFLLALSGAAAFVAIFATNLSSPPKRDFWWWVAAASWITMGVSFIFYVIR
jgi:hypothetical protein